MKAEKQDRFKIIGIAKCNRRYCILDRAQTLTEAFNKLVERLISKDRNEISISKSWNFYIDYD